MLDFSLKKILFIFIIIVIICIVNFPIYWMFRTSIQPVTSVVDNDISILPTSFDFSSYKKIWNSLDYASHIKFKNSLINSFLVVGSSMIISVILAIFAGYSLARYRYRGKKIISQGILYVYMFPRMMFVIPLLILIIKLHLYNTLTSLVIVYCTFSLPYSIWMMQGYFQSIPKELEEAAMIDGCSRFEAFRKIILPLVVPGISATAIYAFILGWNNVLYPLTFISLDTKQVVSVGFMSLISGDVTPWQGVMAASVLSSIPVVILFLFLQKSLVKGLTAGSVKS